MTRRQLLRLGALAAAAPAAMAAPVVAAMPTYLWTIEPPGGKAFQIAGEVISFRAAVAGRWRITSPINHFTNDMIVSAGDEFLFTE